MSIIRNVLVGLEAVFGVEPTTFEAVRPTPGGWDSDTKDDQESVMEWNASHVEEQDSTIGVGVQESTLTVEMYFDQFGIWLTMLNGVPTTTTGVGGAIGVNSHLWKRGFATPKSAAFMWFDGVTWRKSLGNVLNTLDVTQVAEKRLKATMKFLGMPESEIATPTIPAFAYAAYNHPISATKQQFKVAGSAYTTLQSSKWSFNNGRKPHYGTQPSAAPTSFDQGAMTQHADVVADFAAYAGSFYAGHKTNTAPGTVEYLVVDTGTSIGTGTPTNPSLSLKFPNPKAKVSKRDFKKPTLEQTAALFGRYDSGTASYFNATLVNEKAAAAYAGT